MKWIGPEITMGRNLSRPCRSFIASPGRISVSLQMPALKNTDNGPEVIPENEGNKVDSEKLWTALDTAIGSGADHLDLDGADCYLKPEVTLESPEIRAFCGNDRETFEYDRYL